MLRGFSRFVPFLFLRGTVPKGSATQSGSFPKKEGNRRVWKTPGLASLKQTHLCDTPCCNVSCDNCAISPIKTSTKYFCDTIATSIARYEKYRCWASKRESYNICLRWCLEPRHPDRHASATSPSLLRDDQNLHNNYVTVCTVAARRAQSKVHRLPAMICGQSLRFVYAVKLYAAILSGKFWLRFLCGFTIRLIAVAMH